MIYRHPMRLFSALYEVIALKHRHVLYEPWVKRLCFVSELFLYGLSDIIYRLFPIYDRPYIIPKTFKMYFRDFRLTEKLLCDTVEDALVLNKDSHISVFVLFPFELIIAYRNPVHIIIGFLHHFTRVQVLRSLFFILDGADVDTCYHCSHENDSSDHTCIQFRRKIDGICHTDYGQYCQHDTDKPFTRYHT